MPNFTPNEDFSQLSAITIVARQTQIPRDLLDWLAVFVLPTDSLNRVHYQHPYPRRSETQTAPHTMR